MKDEKVEAGINQLRDTAENHPNVKSVKNLLGGEIVNIDIKDGKD